MKWGKSAVCSVEMKQETTLKVWMPCGQIWGNIPKIYKSSRFYWISLKQISFSWKGNFTKESENAQPYQHLRPSTSCKKPKYQTTKGTQPKDKTFHKCRALTSPTGNNNRVTCSCNWNALEKLCLRFCLKWKVYWYKHKKFSGWTTKTQPHICRVSETPNNNGKKNSILTALFPQKSHLEFLVGRRGSCIYLGVLLSNCCRVLKGTR